MDDEYLVNLPFEGINLNVSKKMIFAVHCDINGTGNTVQSGIEF